MGFSRKRRECHRIVEDDAGRIAPDQSRCDAIDTHVVRRKVCRQVPGEVGLGSLCAGIRELLRSGHGPVRDPISTILPPPRRFIDSALSRQSPASSPRSCRTARETRHRCFPERHQVRHAGCVADENVDAARSLGDASYERANRVRVTDVAPDAVVTDRRFSLRSSRRNAVAFFLGSAADHHLSACGREARGDSSPDPFRRTGDDRYFACKVEQLHGRTL